MCTLRLFHTGFQVIRRPDIHIGRKNADFGQGFYLSDDEEFSRRWARERRGQATYLNAYTLQLSGLRVKRLSKDAEWFAYIYANRAGRPDALAGFDVIVGPIANDTIYDTWGMLTSGLIPKDQALRLLMLGPCYTQTVIKTQKAADALCFIGAEEIGSETIAAYRQTVQAEQTQFQEQFAKLLDELTRAKD